MRGRKIIIFSIVLVFSIVGVCVVNYWVQNAKVQQTYVALPTTTISIKNHKFQVKIANTLAAATQGLSGQWSLADNEGMYFIFPQLSQSAFWMKDMHFAIDILWVRQNTIVGIDARVPSPAWWNFFSPLPLYPSPGLVDKVLEINAGLTEKLGIKVGDMVVQ